MQSHTLSARLLALHRFLGAGAGSRGAAAFESMRAEFATSHTDCKFLASVAELPALAQGPVLALVAGRTCDAPQIFDELCAKGVTHIYLEKPGADSAARLEAMRQKAEAHGVGWKCPPPPPTLLQDSAPPARVLRFLTQELGPFLLIPECRSDACIGLKNALPSPHTRAGPRRCGGRGLQQERGAVRARGAGVAEAAARGGAGGATGDARALQRLLAWLRAGGLSLGRASWSKATFTPHLPPWTS